MSCGENDANEAFAAQYAAEQAIKYYGNGSWEHVSAEFYSAKIDKIHGRGDWLGDWHDKVKAAVDAALATHGRGSWVHTLAVLCSLSLHIHLKKNAKTKKLKPNLEPYVPGFKGCS